MSAPSFCLSEEEKEDAIARFVRLIQFETVSSTGPTTGAYKECAEWLAEQCRDVGVFSDVFLLPEAPGHSPVVVAAWDGADKSLPVLLLNSHYDVVPANESDWTVAPFEGIRTDEGRIYGRGTQDMKCVCIQYVLAIQKLRTMYPDWKPSRSVYLTFVPDEEIGGAGMACFLESKTYKDLPGIALALDEGLACEEENVYSVFYGERLPWWVDVVARGPTGHGSRFIQNTAVEQLLELTTKAMEFRTGQRNLLGLDDHTNCAHAVAAAKAKQQKAAGAAPTNGGGNGHGNDKNKRKMLGDVTTLNITSLQAGVISGGDVAYNCIPPEAKCTLDIRISPHMEPAEMKSLLTQWCQECSGSNKFPDDAAAQDSRVTWSYSMHGNAAQEHATTSIDKDQNSWYKVFSDVIQGGGGGGIDIGKSVLEPQVFPAATDSRFLRALGIRALGFSPMKNSAILLHENDEYIDESVFLDGIVVYVALIKALGEHLDK